ncbi:MAG: FkbM family methyltransferase [Thermoplasmata archaeon]|nr:FkbM family methyltransferase [Thermoplasmata archaeon]
MSDSGAATSPPGPAPGLASHSGTGTPNAASPTAEQRVTVKPALRTRLSWLFDDLHGQATGAENPQVLWKVRRLGGRSVLRFPGGFALPVDRVNYTTIRKLVELASYGATLGPLNGDDPTKWGVSLAPGLIDTPSKIRFTLDSLHPLIFAETFLYDLHFPGPDVQGKNIVDAGAFVGDTALYFASLGANVHSYEPEPGNARLLQQNVELNPTLRPRIFTHAEAVWEDGTVQFGSGRGGGGSIFVRGATPVSIPSVSLRTILNRIDGPPHLLKVDCKGAEFGLVRQPAISEFPSVHIEYAADFRPGRTVGELIQALRDLGFSHIRRFKPNWGGFDFEVCGMIHATR